MHGRVHNYTVSHCSKLEGTNTSESPQLPFYRVHHIIIFVSIHWDIDIYQTRRGHLCSKSTMYEMSKLEERLFKCQRWSYLPVSILASFSLFNVSCRQYSQSEPVNSTYKLLFVITTRLHIIDLRSPSFQSKRMHVIVRKVNTHSPFFNFLI